MHCKSLTIVDIIGVEPKPSNRRAVSQYVCTVSLCVTKELFVDDQTYEKERNL